MSLRSHFLSLLAVIFSGPIFAAEATWKWEPIGIGGGGQFLNPAISPHDPKLLFSSSDMGGVYRSEDGGLSWSMIPQAALKRLEYAPHSQIWAFHPTNPNRVFVSAADGFFRSEDRGKSWLKIEGDWDAKSSPRIVTFNPKSPDFAIAFFDQVPAKDQTTLYSTKDGGRTWQKTAVLPEQSGTVIQAAFVAGPEGNGLVIGCTRGIYRSDASGVHFTKSETGLPTGPSEFADFDGSAGIFYTSASAESDAKQRKLYVSRDGGKTWNEVQRAGNFNHLAVSAANPKIVYASTDGGKAGEPAGLFRSDDAGGSWLSIWNHDIASSHYDITNSSWLSGLWGSTHSPSGIAIDPKNPAHVFTTTITSALVSDDSGKTWRQVHAPAGSANQQRAGGMMVTTCWNYYVHPSSPKNHYAALTDFAGWSSADGGKIWQYGTTGNSWHNAYALAIDPEDPQRVWAACSVTHDLPTYKYQSGLGSYAGGIASSADGGATWSMSDSKSGLPKKAVTDVWLDPASAKTARRLWAALPGEGIFTSVDSGVSWQARNTGFDKGNMNLLRIKGDGSGKLYALCTVRLQGSNRMAGALYASADQGTSWRKIFTEKNSPFLTNFTVGAGAIYICALSTLYNDDAGGGIWKSSDGGQSWKQIFDQPAYSLTIDPTTPQRLLISCWKNRGDGLYQSNDGGTGWSRIDSYPYWEPLAISYDPSSSKIIYVTNFGGGVFRGTSD